MGEVYKEEVAALQREFDWVLSVEVPSVLAQLRAAVLQCAQRFPVQVGDKEQGQVGAGQQPVDKFLLTSSEHVKVVVSLAGDTITQADINLKLPRPHSKDAYHNTSVREEVPWVLQQVQDSANFLHKVCDILQHASSYTFTSAGEVNNMMGQVMNLLQGARNALVLPKKRSLEELVVSKNVKALVPSLPREVAVSFYLQSFKLIFAVYHMVTDKGVSRFDRYEAHCVVPWVNEVLLLLTVSMQTAQQLRDKIDIFSQYKQEIKLDQNQ